MDTFIRSFVARFGAIALAIAATTAIGGAAATPTIVTPNAVAWAHGTGADAGTMVALLDGNPEKTGSYTMRMKLPAGTRFAPHMHAGDEHVTVISGTLYVGLGDTMNASTMKALPAGSYVAVPANLHHYAMAKAETVIQISGIGPDKTTMLPTKK